MGKRVPIHEKSCSNCKYCGYYEADIGETLSSDSSGWICDGHKNPGVANLKSFPFHSQQKCFKEKN